MQPCGPFRPCSGGRHTPLSSSDNVRSALRTSANGASSRARSTVARRASTRSMASDRLSRMSRFTACLTRARETPIFLIRATADTQIFSSISAASRSVSATRRAVEAWTWPASLLRARDSETLRATSRPAPPSGSNADQDEYCGDTEAESPNCSARASLVAVDDAPRQGHDLPLQHADMHTKSSADMALP